MGDVPMLSELLNRTPGSELIVSVGADEAYDIKASHAAIAKCGAMAIIPTRKNGRLWKENTPGASVRNKAVPICQFCESTNPPPARLSKRVYSPRKARRTVPVGPLRCLPIMTSAMPLSGVSGL